MVCSDCGKVLQNKVISSEKGLYFKTGERGNYSTLRKRVGSVYKRIDHIRDYYYNLLGVKVPKIPEEIYPALKKQLDRYKIDPETYSEFHVRKALRALGLARLYEYTPHFLIWLTKDCVRRYHPPVIPLDLIEKHKEMFWSIQEVYYHHVSPNRKNFFNLSFLANRFCVLLNDYKYIHLFRLPRTSKVLEENERIFRACCEELGWNYM